MNRLPVALDTVLVPKSYNVHDNHPSEKNGTKTGNESNMVSEI